MPEIGDEFFIDSVELGRVARVAKVHKSGRITFEGSPDQWSPSFTDGTLSRKTGTRFRPYTYAYPATPEAKAARARADAVHEAKSVIFAEIDRLSAIGRGKDAEAIIAEADVIRTLKDSPE